MRSHPVLVGVLAWVAVVTVAAGITWAVINAAGQQVLTEGTVMPPLPAVSRSASDARTSAGTPDPSGPATSSSPPAGASSSPARAATPPAYTERAWQGPAGVVLAGCTGGAIDLRAATPNDGYHVEVGSRGPREVEVKFEGPSEREVKVRAECVGGDPRFRTESDSSDD
jgi:hypothetical protein